MTRFTMQDLHRSKAAGRNGHILHQNGKKYSKKAAKIIPRPSPQKEWIEQNLQWWCNKHAVSLEREVKFAADRKWRFDWAIPAHKIAIEYEGIFSIKSGHTTHDGFTKNTDKYNRAAAEGWKVLRFTAVNYKNLVNELNGCI